MNNVSVEAELNNCQTELTDVSAEIAKLGIMSNVVPFLTKYALIRACGTLEQAYKAIVADYCSKSCSVQLERFLNRKVRESSANPSLGKIYELVKDFDDTWLKSLKSALKSHPDQSTIQTSISSLVDSRNEFAHGGNPKVSIGDVQSYFLEARKMVEMMDSIIK
jgi:hypothetical protein